MVDKYILIGAKKNDTYKSKHEVAHHAMHIDTLVKAYKNGTKEHMPYMSKSKNPGVDLVNHINDNHPDCEAIVLGQKLQYANNLKNSVSIKDKGGSDIDTIVEKYTSGKLYGLNIKPEKKTETPYHTPKKDASGEGVRAQKGRGGHPPELQEKYGLGSKTEKGRVDEGKPKRAAYERAV